MSFTASDIPLTSSFSGVTIKESVYRGFVGEAVGTAYFDAYFAKCAPNTCEYTLTDKRSAAEILAIVVGLIGGLNTFLQAIIGAAPMPKTTDNEKKEKVDANP